MSEEYYIGTVKLEYPIKNGSELVNEIRLRHGRVADFRQANKLADEGDQGRFLLAKLSGYSEEFIDRLVQVDADQLGLLVAESRKKSRATSTTA